LGLRREARAPPSPGALARLDPPAVRVEVMEIGAVRVMVLESLVPVRVAVDAGKRRIVRVEVMAVVVPVRVLVRDGLVAVGVAVRLRRVEPGGDREGGGRRRDQRRLAAIAQRERARRADEGREREERSGASDAEHALRAQIEEQAEPEPGRAERGSGGALTTKR
jgi:hypothetical protein